MIKNNRRKTSGRKVQVIDIPELITRNGKAIKNPHPNAGSKIQIRHI